MPKSPEQPYDINRAQEEANKLQKKVESGEVKSYAEAELRVDKESKEWKRAWNVHEVFTEIIREISPNVETDYDDYSGLTFFLTPFRGREEGERIIQQVFDKFRERGYEVSNDGTIDAGRMKWFFFVTEEGSNERWQGDKLRFSCQAITSTLR